MIIKKTARFKKDFKKILRQRKDILHLQIVLNLLFEKEPIDIKYQNHKLIKAKDFDDCYELHIEPDWLLIYKYSKEEKILYLVRTGSHSDLYEQRPLWSFLSGII
ncbi:MAG: type II toxin-antitoxin system YafQ family toxin [Erysipelotrichaceae bacterium]|nr:type II toxin-antitoxin system YafQ family toxin [Erysipelotrichaceae bacterium]